MILMDTHTWLWWCADTKQLSAKAARHLRKAQAEETLAILSFSCWELAMLVAKERVGLHLDVELWIERSLTEMNIRLLDLSPKAAVLATRLGGNPPSDPIDRLLIATALVHQCPIVTKDQQIQRYPHIHTIW